MRELEGWFLGKDKIGERVLYFMHGMDWRGCVCHQTVTLQVNAKRTWDGAMGCYIIDSIQCLRDFYFVETRQTRGSDPIMQFAAFLFELLPLFQAQPALPSTCHFLSCPTFIFPENTQLVDAPRKDGPPFHVSCLPMPQVDLDLTFGYLLVLPRCRAYPIREWKMEKIEVNIM